MICVTNLFYTSCFFVSLDGLGVDTSCFLVILDGLGVDFGMAYIDLTTEGYLFYSTSPFTLFTFCSSNLPNYYLIPEIGIVSGFSVTYSRVV